MSTYDIKISENHPEIPRLLKIREVAEILNLGNSTVYQLIRRGDLPSVRFGRAVRIRPVDLEKFVKSNISER